MTPYRMLLDVCVSPKTNKDLISMIIFTKSVRDKYDIYVGTCI